MKKNQVLSAEHHSKVLSFFERDVVFFDLETTGLSPANNFIIEIGAVKLCRDGNSEQLQTLIKPLILIPEKSKKIHGISDEDVKDSPGAETALVHFFDFVKGCDLIAHNAMFDLGFLINEAKRLKLKLPIVNVYDSLKLTRKLLPKQSLKPDDFKLSTLAKFIDFDYQAHRALDDTLAMLHVWNYTVQNSNADHEVDNAYKKSMVFSTKKVKAYNENTEKFNLLSQLSNKQQNTVVVYNGGSRRGKERPIKPIALIPLPNHVSLYARCHIDQTFKIFSLDKIQFVRAFTPQEEQIHKETKELNNGA